MGSNLNIRLNDRRERQFEYLQEATGENTTSGAIDAAAQYYVRMAGDTGAYPSGSLEELMEAAIEQGSLTAPEIAEILDSEELPVEYEQEWTVGD